MGMREVDVKGVYVRLALARAAYLGGDLVAALQAARSVGVAVVAPELVRVREDGDVTISVVREPEVFGRLPRGDDAGDAALFLVFSVAAQDVISVLVPIVLVVVLDACIPVAGHERRRGGLEARGRRGDT